MILVVLSLTNFSHCGRPAKTSLNICDLSPGSGPSVTAALIRLAILPNFELDQGR